MKANTCTYTWFCYVLAYQIYFSIIKIVVNNHNFIMETYTYLPARSTMYIFDCLDLFSLIKFCMKLIITIVWARLKKKKKREREDEIIEFKNPYHLI